MTHNVSIDRVYTRHVAPQLVPLVIAASKVGRFTVTRQIFSGVHHWRAVKHSDDMAVAFVKRGTATVNGIPIDAGGAFWVYPDQNVTAEWAPQSQAVCAYLDASALPDSAHELSETSIRTRPSRISRTVEAGIEAFLEGHGVDNGRISEYLAMQLLIDGVAALIIEAQDIATFNAVASRTPYETVMMFLQMNSTRRDLTVDNVASALKISGRTLQRALSEKNTTLTLALREIRTEHALRLLSLKDSSMSLTRIAEITGFANPASLRKALRDHQDREEGRPVAVEPPTHVDFSSTGEITPLRMPDGKTWANRLRG